MHRRSLLPVAFNFSFHYVLVYFSIGCRKKVCSFFVPIAFTLRPSLPLQILSGFLPPNNCLFTGYSWFELLTVACIAPHPYCCKNSLFLQKTANCSQSIHKSRMCASFIFGFQGACGMRRPAGVRLRFAMSCHHAFGRFSHLWAGVCQKLNLPFS